MATDVKTLPQTPVGPLVAVIAMTDSGGAAVVNSITQTSATWQRAIQGGTGDDRVEIWWSGDAAGASTTVTIDYTADQNEAALVAEPADIRALAGTELDQIASTSGSAASSASTGTTPVTTDPDEIWIGGVAVRNGSSLSSPTNSFVIDGDDASGAGGDHVSATLLSRVVGAQAAATAGATIDSSPADFGGATATFFVTPPPPLPGTVGDGWGKDSWGTSPWGGAVPLDPLAIENARALSTKEIEVTLNRPAQVIAPTVAGDALNPITWNVQRLDTAFLFSVISVAQTGPTTFVLSVLQDIGPARSTHRVSTTTLLDAIGGFISSPNSFDFAGLLEAAAKDAVTRAQRDSGAVQDVANPPLPQTEPATFVGGTLLINSGGDYERESGAPFIKKLILRRLLTLPGGFFHLPDYGIGLGVKELLPATNLLQLRASIIRQVEREPEVVEADVRLLLGLLNDLEVQVRARLRSGDPINISFQVTSEGVVL